MPIRTLTALALSAGFAFALGLAGCGESAPTDPESEVADSDASADPEIAAALAKLSPEDRTLAQEQGTCPVAEEPLGSMGTPIKVTVDGRSVFVCCSGCIDTVKENPEEYLAPSEE